MILSIGIFILLAGGYEFVEYNGVHGQCSSVFADQSLCSGYNMHWGIGVFLMVVGAILAVCGTIAIAADKKKEQ